MQIQNVNKMIEGLTVRDLLPASAMAQLIICRVLCIMGGQVYGLSSIAVRMGNLKREGLKVS